MPRPTKLINLMRGWPSPGVLPASLLSAACQRALAHPAESTPLLQYGPDAGHEPLREGLARWLARHYGVEPDARRICVTGGASQSLACVLQSFTDPVYTRAVWVVEPCYHLACGIFDDAGFAGRLRAVPGDDEGVDVEALRAGIGEVDESAGACPQPEPLKMPGPARKLYRHVIYCVPTCSNPTGVSMSLRRREALVRLARAHDALVVCDDVYDFLQWPLEGDTRPERSPEMRLPRLCDLDLGMGRADNDPMGFGHAVSNGSFSKIAGPGMRTGWVEASPAFVTGLSRTASTLSGGAPSQFCAGVLGYLVQDGRLEKHIEDTVRPSLQRRHRIMMDAVHRHLSPLGIHVRESSVGGKDVYGGYFIWLTSRPGQLPASRLVADAALDEANLVIAPGNIFEVHGDERRARFDRDIRLCFAWEAEDDLVEGVRRLGHLLERMQNNKSYYEEQAGSRQDFNVDANK
ncbi:aminotransferase class I and II domain-containing protein [Hirsutella rhossiliensis]|uniref:Aminotransferase class I and II domain-containing protein n=1 Tax=Hirsutella rhossiliensis TaxID=111463 RepID=A0A9P8SF26_9HYPO|nr:aminotransferase class I and II domain-containing protein [Hirsutella rhossiliensis]KAH0960301.1 aminotransferase class I and II domain-containing protein [Hirsutella rhossiliensis]